MNNIIEGVWTLANKFMDSAKFVTIDNLVVAELAKSVVERAALKTPFWGLPSCIAPAEADTRQKTFLYELIANSVNYCYWYGRHDIRPNGANSTKMYTLLDESFVALERMKESTMFHPRSELEILIGIFINKLSKACFPLIDHRVRHLNEILNRSDLLSVIEASVQREDYSVDRWLEYMITSFPGYSKDLFLKRAFLFIMSMYRRCKIFEEEINSIPIPADYQVPKMLRWLRCIRYSGTLASLVDNNVLVPEGSIMECEIRAATILACREIANRAGCSCEQVDTYLWGQRKICTDPFHLTITTNY